MPTVTPVDHDPFSEGMSTLFHSVFGGPISTGNPTVDDLNSMASTSANKMVGIGAAAAYTPYMMANTVKNTVADVPSMKDDLYSDSPFGKGRPSTDTDTMPLQNAARMSNAVGLLAGGGVTQAEEGALGSFGGKWSAGANDYLNNQVVSAVVKKDKDNIVSHIQQMKDLGPGDEFTKYLNAIPDDGAYLAMDKIHGKALSLHDAPAPTHEEDVFTNPPIGDLSAIKPIENWATYAPANAPKPLAPVDPGTAARISAMGFNPNLQLHKGMTWHQGSLGEEPGEVANGLGPLGGFADPSLKPNERGIFTTARPDVANLYAGVDDPMYHPSEGGGYNMVPMLARANKAFSVDWPKYNSVGGPDYEGGAMEELLDHIRAQGGDMAAIHGIRDWGGVDTQYVPLNNNQLRVRHAAFNPADLDSPDLMKASAAPILTPVDHDPFKDDARGR